MLLEMQLQDIRKSRNATPVELARDSIPRE